MSDLNQQLKPLDQPVYNYFTAFYKCFYSKLLYIDIGKRWKGCGALYLLMLLVFLTAPFSVRMVISFNQSFEEQLMQPLLEIPNFYIQNGKANFDKPMPYLITDKKKRVVAIVDTTGKINGFTAQYPYLTTLITEDKIAFRMPNPQLFTMTADSVPNQGKIIEQYYDKHSNLVFNGKSIFSSNTITGLQYGSLFMLYPLIVAIFFSTFLVFYMVLGLLGQTFSGIFFSYKLSFMTSTRLMMVAGTPMLLVLLTAISFNGIFMGMGFLLFGLLIAYYAFAVYSLRSESRRISLL